MRESLPQQLSVVPAGLEHAHARELEAMSNLLDQLPEMAAWVHEDLVRGLRMPDRGRKGMSAEQVLRVLLLKQMKGFSYDELSFELAASICYQRFCRFGANECTPKRSSLQRDLKRVHSETLERINRRLVGFANDQKAEHGRTVVTVHAPTFS